MFCTSNLLVIEVDLGVLTETTFCDPLELDYLSSEVGKGIEGRRCAEDYSRCALSSFLLRGNGRAKQTIQHSSQVRQVTCLEKTNGWSVKTQTMISTCLPVTKDRCIVSIVALSLFRHRHPVFFFSPCTSHQCVPGHWLIQRQRTQGCDNTTEENEQIETQQNCNGKNNYKQQLWCFDITIRASWSLRSVVVLWCVGLVCKGSDFYHLSAYESQHLCGWATT